MDSEMSGLKRGLYPFTHLVGDSPTRFHLRVDPDGAGLLLANSAEAAHLSPVGAVMAHGVLSEKSDRDTRDAVRARFHGAFPHQIWGDLGRVRELIVGLATPEDNYPVTNFGGGASAYERRLSAPFQAHVPQGRPDAIEPILRALWDAGVPQVTFPADPSQDARGLVRLVEMAEDLGMIAGIRAAAGQLPEGVLRDAAMAGLDFLTLIAASCDAGEHDALLGEGDHAAMQRGFEVCHEMELCPVAQVPLTDGSADELEEIIEFALAQDVRNLSYFAIACLDGEEEADAAGALPARALPQVATEITECAEDLGARFIWDPPVRFAPTKSLAKHVLKGPRAGGEVSIRVEADGTVYAPRGPRAPCGNIVEQPWEAIWAHEAFTRYRESVEAPSRCEVCPDLELCAAACPRDPAGWADDTDEGGES